MPPAVSVIMLAYNRPQFMRQAIESVLNQTFRDFEFLILDNGSKGDEVYNIAKEYADKDSRVRVFRVADNLGISLGKNKLIHQAQADYVAPIDDDNFWELNKLEIQLNFMRENSDVGVYSCSYIWITEEGKPTSSQKILNDAINPPSRAIGDMCLIEDNFFGSEQIFRRDALLAIGGWRSYFLTADDFDLFFRLQEKYKYASTNKQLASKRTGAKKARKSKSGWEQLGSAPGWRLYRHMTFISAFHRRQDKQDPVENSPNPEECVVDNMLALMDCFLADKDIKRGERWLRKTVKWMLRRRYYDVLRKVMYAYRQSNAPQKRELYLRLWAWSVWYGRLGYWFKF